MYSPRQYLPERCRQGSSSRVRKDHLIELSFEVTVKLLCDCAARPAASGIQGAWVMAREPGEALKVHEGVSVRIQVVAAGSSAPHKAVEVAPAPSPRQGCFPRARKQAQPGRSAQAPRKRKHTKMFRFVGAWSQPLLGTLNHALSPLKPAPKPVVLPTGALSCARDPLSNARSRERALHAHALYSGSNAVPTYCLP